MWNKINFTGIELDDEEKAFIAQNMEEAIVYWSDADCKHWIPTFRTKPFEADGFWVDVFDVDLVAGVCTAHVFQRDEPMAGKRLAHHLNAVHMLEALV